MKTTTKQLLLEQMREWTEQKGFFTSHEVIIWGTQNFYNSADRVRRTLIEEGRVVRELNPNEKSAETYIYKTI